MREEGGGRIEKEGDCRKEKKVKRREQIKMFAEKERGNVEY